MLLCCIGSRSQISRAIFLSGESVLSPGPSGVSQHRLIRRAACLRFLSLAPSNRSSYSTGQRRYLGFCDRLDVPHFPLAEQTLCLWAAEMSYHLAYGTISQYISAVRNMSIELGYRYTSIRLSRAFESKERYSSFTGGKSSSVTPPNYCFYFTTFFTVYWDII